MRASYKSALIFSMALAAMSAATYLFLLEKVRVPVFGAVQDYVVPAPSPVQSASIFWLGDIMLGRDVETRLKAKSPLYAFSGLPELREARAVVGNFEASIPLVHEPTPDLFMKFSVDPVLLSILAEGGLTHLSLANNHALDYLESGYRNTVYELGLRGFDVFGHPVWVSEKASVSYIEADDKNFAVIGINATYGQVDMEEVRKIIREVESESVMQIVYIHWGEEYVRRHSNAQEELAHDLIDSGVDMIIGHHPHVVQDIGEYKGALIFYSLGNFIFDQYFSSDVEEGLMLELLVKGEELSLLLHPVETRTTRVRPVNMTGNERQIFLSNLALRSDVAIKDEIAKGSILLQF